MKLLQGRGKGKGVNIYMKGRRIDNMEAILLHDERTDLRIGWVSTN